MLPPPSSVSAPSALQASEPLVPAYASSPPSGCSTSFTAPRPVLSASPAMASVLSSEEEMISGFVLIYRPTLKIHSQGIIAPKNIK
jgi:hypothetical protein